jgi:hypothetical protein
MIALRKRRSPISIVSRVSFDQFSVAGDEA